MHPHQSPGSGIALPFSRLPQDSTEATSTGCLCSLPNCLPGPPNRASTERLCGGPWGSNTLLAEQLGRVNFWSRCPLSWLRTREPGRASQPRTVAQHSSMGRLVQRPALPHTVLPASSTPPSAWPEDPDLSRSRGHGRPLLHGSPLAAADICPMQSRPLAVSRALGPENRKEADLPFSVIEANGNDAPWVQAAGAPRRKSLAHLGDSGWLPGG